MRPRAPLAVLVLAVLVLPALPGPAASAPPANAVPIGPLGVPLDIGPGDLVAPVQGMLPEPAGTVVHTTFLYGPHDIPPGWDLDRYTVSLPFETGFVTRLEYHLVDAATGESYTNLQVHIHHALWFNPQLTTGGFGGEFVMGTGEERSVIDLGLRAAADPAGPLYGLQFLRQSPQVLVLMLHNKQTTPHQVVIRLDVDFVYGTSLSIRDASDCAGALPAPLSDITGCAAGRRVHDVHGALFGEVFDVPREPQGDGVFTFPTDGEHNLYGPPDYGLPLPTLPRFGNLLREVMPVTQNATLVFGGGHLHPGGIATVVANLGPDGSGCEADLDGDGLPGVTLYRSDKIDRNPAAWPYSEDFQMGVTKPGFRAPLRTGDRLAQFALYANGDVATYNAMTFAGLLVDPAQRPAPRTPGPCQLGELRAHLLGDPGGDPVETVMNRAWDGPELALCGVPDAAACDTPVPLPAPGLDSPPAVGIAAFLYAPGDLNLAAPLGAPPVVHAGQSLGFVNLDTAAIVRHTVTSCAWPCNGPYTANYPLPDGAFDSDRLGNMDLGDGGSVPPDSHDDALWSTPGDLPAGYYAYFCRIHPSMRGAFEVVP
ncbi:MAG: hypothetical protein LC624_09760 [Halobacteriales archaeon]|nr:hypothetical protein [Halobacteriales archaeon]